VKGSGNGLGREGIGGWVGIEDWMGDGNSAKEDAVREEVAYLVRDPSWLAPMEESWSENLPPASRTLCR
jgi:hypothetical protein